MSIENFKLNQTLARIVAANTKTPRIIPMLVGEAAIGKSSWAQSFAAQNNTKVFIISVNTLADKADVTATKTEVHEDGTVSQRFFPMYTVKSANDYALDNPDKLVYIFADEINRADSDVTSAIQTMFTERRNGDLKLADNIRFIAAGNDKGNITQLDSASRTRFSLYHVVPDADIFLKLLGDNLSPYIKNVLSKYPEYILSRPETNNVTIVDEDVDGTGPNNIAMNAEFTFGDESDEMMQFTAPRTLEGLSDTLNDLSISDLDELVSEDIGRNSNALQQLVYAHIGETPCAAAILEEIIKDLSKNHGTSGADSLVNSAKPSKPQAWTQAMKAKSYDELEVLVDGLSPAQRAEMFFYITYSNPNEPKPSSSQKIESSLVEILLSYTDTNSVEFTREQLSNMVLLARESMINRDVIDMTQRSGKHNSALATKMSLMASFI